MSESIGEARPSTPAYTCDGEDVSPALAWEDVPAEAAELVLIVEDPDAPGGTFAHWLAYGIEPGEAALPEGVPQGGEVEGFRQGENDMGTVGYGGPCPPEGETHDYVFRLLAVDTKTGLEGGASRERRARGSRRPRRRRSELHRALHPALEELRDPRGRLRRAVALDRQ